MTPKHLSFLYRKEGKVAYSKYLPSPVELFQGPAIKTGTSPRKKVSNTLRLSTLIQSTIEEESSTSYIASTRTSIRTNSSENRGLAPNRTASNSTSSNSIEPKKSSKISHTNS